MRHSLSDLAAVIAVARHRSFRAAAVELAMSTTSLSNAIARIEGELGVRLFNRTTRSVSPTDAGLNFIDQIAPALRDIRAAVESAQAQQAVPSGVLRINAFATAAREILSTLVLPFVARYPQVHVDLVTEGRLVDIVADGFDLGVRSADLVPSDMIAVPLGRPRAHVVVASPAYFAGHPPPRLPTDLPSHRCIRVRLPNGALFRWPFEKGGQSVQIEVAGPITLDEASLARAAVLDGIGIGFFMEADVRDDIVAGRLVRVLEDWTPPGAPLSLYYPGRKNPSAAFRAFVELARQQASSQREA
jgi:DNA-binding transcriptional LysR family regulator